MTSPSPVWAELLASGVYDLGRNAGWVNVGIDHNTAAFAVESIRRWWNQLGRPQYPEAKRLFISADGGGSNGSRVRLWKWELQQLADETGLALTVCHLPPGTSTLIASTTTQAGLTVQCQLDTTSYPTGRKVSDEDMTTLFIIPDAFHGEWNYTLFPRTGSIDSFIL